MPAGKPRHLGWGDRERAFGLGQFDVRYQSAFIHSPAAETPVGQFRRICTILVANCRDFEHSASFNSDADMWRCAVAAYNASFGRVLHAYVTLGPQAVDGVTTGGDYPTDIFKKAERLRAAAPDLFPAPPDASGAQPASVAGAVSPVTQS